MIYFTFARIANDYILGAWAEKPENQHSKFSLYGPLCLAGPFVIALGVAMRGATMQLFTWRAAKILHRDMIKRVLGAPINLYYDVTPTGRILNKFSKDLSVIET